MTSQCVASRSSRGRCASCNQQAVAWICDACAFGSMYYRTKFTADARPTTPTMVGRRNLYPKPSCVDEYADLGSPPPISDEERLARIRERMESSDPVTQAGAMALLKRFRNEAQEYASFAKFVDSNGTKRDYKLFAHTNLVHPSDPRRWCYECIAYRRHRRGCALIDTEGPYIGGYPDDGLRSPIKFARLKMPSDRWSAVNWRQHTRAMQRRWDAFIASWASIGLDVFTRAISSASPVAIPVNQIRQNGPG